MMVIGVHLPRFTDIPWPLSEDWEAACECECEVGVVLFGKGSIYVSSNTSHCLTLSCLHMILLSYIIGGLVFLASFMHSKDKEGNAVMSAQPRDLFTEETLCKPKN